MRCDRSARLDLAAFLAGEETFEVREFRAHYPSCPDCAAEVRVWMELHAELDPRPGTRQHPSEELLLQFESQPERMSAVARSAVETHLATCASCRDELQALRGFDFSLLQRPTPAPSPTDASDGREKIAWWRSLLLPVRTVLLHPAFAYGLVLLLLLPQLATFSQRKSPAAPAVQRPAEQRWAAAPPAEHAVAPREAERRDEPAGTYLADEEIPQRLREVPSGGTELRAGGAPPAAAVSKDARERFAVAEPAPSDKQKRELDSLAARQAPERKAGPEETQDAAKSLRQLGYARSFRGDASGEEAERGEQTSGKRLTIQMDPSGRNNIPMQGMLGGATLQIKPQQPINLGSDVAIRIKSADGRRELREIHTASREDGYLEMTVPPGWMSDGVYSLEVWPLDTVPKNPQHRH